MSKAYAITRVLYKIFKHPKINLVSDPKNQIISNKINGNDKYSTELLSKYTSFYDSPLSSTTETVGEKLSGKKAILDLTAAITKEQEDCFNGILPIMVYLYHVLPETINMYEECGMFPSVLYDETEFNKIFTEKNKKKITSTSNFAFFTSKFKSKDITIFDKFNKGIDKNKKNNKDILETQIQNFKSIMKSLKEKLDKQKLIPIQLPPYKSTFFTAQYVPASRSEPPYITLECSGNLQNFLITDNVGERIRNTLLNKWDQGEGKVSPYTVKNTELSGHNCWTVSKITYKKNGKDEMDSIEIKSSLGEGWMNKGSLTVSLDEIDIHTEINNTPELSIRVTLLVCYDSPVVVVKE